MSMNRRTFIVRACAGAATLCAGACAPRSGLESGGAPSYLSGYEAAYRAAPREAATAWFREAKFGLFLHYGLYSLLGRGEWVQLLERIPVAEYGRLIDDFTATDFDADFIAELAVEAGMQYVNLTTRHHDSFCLFRTKQTDFNSVAAPRCGRDLVGELAEACRKRRLGLFLYYSYGADWRHPYFLPRTSGWENARPAYDEPQPEYRFRKDEDFRRYIDFVHAQLRELLTQYGPVAGIWLDPIMGYYSRPDLFPVQQTYALIRSLQPQTLIAFKQGATGDEDFVAPERTPRAHQSGGEIGRLAWARNAGKPIEICDTLQAYLPGIHGGSTWGYNRALDGSHHGPEHVIEMLAHARNVNANLLLNTGPLPEGAIHPADAATLREVGRRLRASS